MEEDDYYSGDDFNRSEKVTFKQMVSGVSKESIEREAQPTQNIQQTDKTVPASAKK